MNFLRLGIAGIRGIIGKGLNADIIVDFSMAVGTYFDEGSVLIATDTRDSSDMIKNGVIASLQSTGCDVIDAGVISAPELQFLIPKLGATGGLLIGAGHHPAGWNAIVPLDKTGAYFNHIQVQELLDVYHGKQFFFAPWDKLGTVTVSTEEHKKCYLDYICSQLDVEAIKSKKYKVVADFCNGSGSEITMLFAKRLGLEMIPINDYCNGFLPHSPEPRPRTSLQIKSIIKAVNADIGFNFNTDMSRMAIVTHKEETLSEEYTFPIIADYLSEKAKTPLCVVTNCCTTRMLDDVILRDGGRVVKTKVGQAYIIDKMVELGAPLGGDGSGSVGYGELLRGYDSLMSMGIILEAMATTNQSITERISRLPKYHIMKRTIKMASGNVSKTLKKIKAYYLKQDNDVFISEKDGIRFDWDRGWAHFRASATEPVIRMILEWEDVAIAEEKALEIQTLLEGGRLS